METEATLDDDLMTGCISIKEYEDGLLALRIAAYKTALRRQDWSYEYADDQRAYAAGRDSFRALQLEQRRIDPDFKIWNELVSAAVRKTGVAA